MSVKIQGLTALTVATLTNCLTPDEQPLVHTTRTTATFMLSRRQATALVLRAQGRHVDRVSPAYKSLHSLVRKLRELDEPPPPPSTPLTFNEILRELDALEAKLLPANETTDHAERDAVQAPPTRPTAADRVAWRQVVDDQADHEPRTDHDGHHTEEVQRPLA